nr:MAG TPA: hypothetical protein [Bacteriophage sp.]
MLERGPGVNIGRGIVSTMGLPMGCVLWFTHYLLDVQRMMVHH